MLIGMDTPASLVRDHTLRQLGEMREYFYLTGSHFFGNARKDSDIDFFTANGVDTVILSKIGFMTENITKYVDISILSVMIHHEAKIHIQIVRDIHRKREAQTLIKNIFMKYPVTRNVMLSANKEQKSVIWNMAFHILREYQ